MSKVMNDSGILQRFISLTIKDLFVESTTIIALTGVALYRRWDITLISLIVLPTAFYGAGRLGKRLKMVVKVFGVKYQKVRYILEKLNKDGYELQRFILIKGEKNGKKTVKITKAP